MEGLGAVTLVQFVRLWSPCTFPLCINATLLLLHVWCGFEGCQGDGACFRGRHPARPEDASRRVGIAILH